MLEKYVVRDACGLKSSSFESVIYYTYLYFFHEGIDKAMNAPKIENSCFRCKNIWHVES